MPTILDRIKLHKNKKGAQKIMAKQSDPTKVTPTQAPLKANAAQPVQNKTAKSAAVPGVNSKLDGSSSGDKSNGRPPKVTPANTLNKAEWLAKASKGLTPEQKHNIIKEVKQTIGQRQINSTNPHEKAHGQNLLNEVDKMVPFHEAPTTIKDTKAIKQPQSADHTKADSNVTKVVAGKQPPAIDKQRTKQMHAINTELGYRNIKSADPHMKQLGKEQLASVPLSAKIKHKGEQLIGKIRSSIKNNPKPRPVQSAFPPKPVHPAVDNNAETVIAKVPPKAAPAVKAPPPGVSPPKPMKPRGVVVKNDIMRDLEVLSKSTKNPRANTANNVKAGKDGVASSGTSSAEFNPKDSTPVTTGPSAPNKAKTIKGNKNQPKVKVTQVYEKPSSFHLGHFVLGMLTNSPVVSKVAYAAKAAIKKE